MLKEMSSRTSAGVSHPRSSRDSDCDDGGGKRPKKRTRRKKNMGNNEDKNQSERKVQKIYDIDGNEENNKQPNMKDDHRGRDASPQVKTQNMFDATNGVIASVAVVASESVVGGFFRSMKRFFSETSLFSSSLSSTVVSNTTTSTGATCSSDNINTAKVIPPTSTKSNRKRKSPIPIGRLEFQEGRRYSRRTRRNNKKTKKRK